METGEADKLVGAVERHKRDPQTGGALAMPLELIVDVLSYLPPPSGRTGTVTAEGRGALPRAMQTCTLMLFLVLENASVTAPPLRTGGEPLGAIAVQPQKPSDDHRCLAESGGQNTDKILDAILRDVRRDLMDPRCIDELVDTTSELLDSTAFKFAKKNKKRW